MQDKTKVPLNIKLFKACIVLALILLNGCGQNDQCIPADDFGNYIYSIDTKVEALSSDLIYSSSIEPAASDVISPLAPYTTENDAYRSSWTEIKQTNASKSPFMVKKGDLIQVKVDGSIDLASNTEVVTLALNQNTLATGVSPVATTKKKYPPGAIVYASIEGTDKTGLMKYCAKDNQSDTTCFNAEADIFDFVNFSVSNPVAQDASLEEYKNPQDWICNIGTTQSYSSYQDITTGETNCDFLTMHYCEPPTREQKIESGNYPIFGTGYIDNGDGTYSLRDPSGKGVTIANSRYENNYILYKDNSGYAICTSNRNRKSLGTIERPKILYSGWSDSDHPHIDALTGTYFAPNGLSCANVSSQFTPGVANMSDTAKKIGGLVKFSLVNGFNRSDWGVKKYVQDINGPPVNDFGFNANGTISICNQPKFSAYYPTQMLMFKSLSNDPYAHNGYNTRRHRIENNLRQGMWQAMLSSCNYSPFVTSGRLENFNSGNMSWTFASAFYSHPKYAIQIMKGLTKWNDFPNSPSEVHGEPGNCGTANTTSDNRKCCSGPFQAAIAAGGLITGFDMNPDEDRKYGDSDGAQNDEIIGDQDDSTFWNICNSALGSSAADKPRKWTRAMTKAQIGGRYYNTYRFSDNRDVMKDSGQDVKPACKILVNGANENNFHVYMDENQSWSVYPKVFKQGDDISIDASRYDTDDLHKEMYDKEIQVKYDIYEPQLVSPQRFSCSDGECRFSLMGNNNIIKSSGSNEDYINDKVSKYGWCYERAPCIQPAMFDDQEIEFGIAAHSKNIPSLKDTTVFLENNIYYGGYNDWPINSKGQPIQKFNMERSRYALKNHHPRECGGKNNAPGTGQAPVWYQDGTRAVYCNSRLGKWYPDTNTSQHSWYGTSHDIWRAFFLYNAFGSSSLYADDDESVSISSHNLYCHPNKTRQCGIAMAFKIFSGNISRCLGTKKNAIGVNGEFNISNPAGDGFLTKCSDSRYTAKQCNRTSKNLGLCVRQVSFITSDGKQKQHSAIMKYRNPDLSAVNVQIPGYNNLIEHGIFDNGNMDDRNQSLGIAFDGNTNTNLELVDSTNCGICLNGSIGNNGYVIGSDIKKTFASSPYNQNGCQDSWTTSYRTKHDKVIKSQDGNGAGGFVCSNTSTTDSCPGLSLTDFYSVTYSFIPIKTQAYCPDHDIVSDYTPSTTSPGFYGNYYTKDGVHADQSQGVLRSLNNFMDDLSTPGKSVYSGKISKTLPAIMIPGDFNGNTPIDISMVGGGNIGNSFGFNGYDASAKIKINFKSGIPAQNGKFLFFYIQPIDASGNPDPTKHPYIISEGENSAIFRTKQQLLQAIKTSQNPNLIDFFAYSDQQGTASFYSPTSGKLWAVIGDRQSANIGGAASDHDGKYIIFDVPNNMTNEEYDKMSVSADGSNVLGYNSGAYTVSVKAPSNTGVNMNIIGDLIDTITPDSLAGKPNEILSNSSGSALSMIKDALFGPMKPSQDCKTFTTKLTDNIQDSNNGMLNATNLEMTARVICKPGERIFEAGLIYAVFNAFVQNVVYQSIFYSIIVLWVVINGYKLIIGELDIKSKTFLQNVLRVAIAVTFASPDGWTFYNRFVVGNVIALSEGLNNAAISTIAGQGDYISATTIFDPMSDTMSIILSSSFFIKLIAAIFSLPYGTGILLAMVLVSTTLSIVLVLLKGITQYISSVIMLAIYLCLGPIVVIGYVFEKYKTHYDKWLKNVITAIAEQFTLFVGMSFFCMLASYAIKALIYKRVCWDVVISIPVGNILASLVGQSWDGLNVPLLRFWKYDDSSGIADIVVLLTGGSPYNTIESFGNSAPGIGTVFMVVILSGVAQKFMDIVQDFGKFGGASSTGALGGLTGALDSMQKSLAQAGSPQGAVSMASSAISKVSDKALEKLQKREAKQEKIWDQASKSRGSANAHNAVKKELSTGKQKSRLEKLSAEKNFMNKADVEKEYNSISADIKDKAAQEYTKTAGSKDSLKAHGIEFEDGIENTLKNRDRENAIRSVISELSKDNNGEVTDAQIKEAMKERKQKVSSDEIKGLEKIINTGRATVTSAENMLRESARDLGLFKENDGPAEEDSSQNSNITSGNENSNSNPNNQSSVEQNNQNANNNGASTNNHESASSAIQQNNISRNKANLFQEDDIIVENIDYEE